MNETIKSIQANRAIKAIDSGVQRVEGVIGLLTVVKDSINQDYLMDSRFIADEEVINKLQEAIEIANNFIAKTLPLAEFLDKVIDKEEECQR